MPLRLAVVVSHPIQHFAPWHREVARLPDLDLRVYFCCDWGIETYKDPQFGIDLQWDIPLLEGYEHEFLPIAKRPKKLSFWEVDNPAIRGAFDRFQPDVVQVFGYGRRTNWRAARWTKRHGRTLMIYSDSDGRSRANWGKQLLKRLVVQHFYRMVDGALYVGDKNRACHLEYGLPQSRLFPGCLPIDRERLLNAVPDRKSARQAIRAQWGIPGDAFLVMFCGKLASHKRPLDLVLAAHELAKRNMPIWAIIVGEGPERKTVEAAIQSLDITNVRLTGFINQVTLPHYYAAADIVALTSERDNHPLVVTEGASFGCPVVISDAVGCIGDKDTAQPGVNAVVYPCSDTLGLANGIKQLYERPEMYAQMSSAAVAISERQDVRAAARELADAARGLHQLGPRRSSAILA